MATAWDLGGIKYDTISKHIADAINHCIIRLNAANNETILDLATGTGWTARQLAKEGKKVTAIDFSPQLLEAAKYLSITERLDISFEIANAEELPFEENSFDKIISTFGIMFCSNPDKVIKEMIRVCKPDGAFAFTAWSNTGAVFDVFQILKKYMPEKKKEIKPTFSPFHWGDIEWVRKIFNPYFDIDFEEGVSTQYAKNSPALWQLTSECYGPIKALVQTLDKSNLTKLKEDFIDYHNQYKTRLGISVPRRYIVYHGILKK